MRVEIEHLGGTRHEEIQSFDQDAIIIGRDDQADIHFERAQAPTVSREHCRICHERGGFWLHDGDRGGRPSTNFTYLNGKKLIYGNATRLATGDIIQLGEGGPQIAFRVSADAMSGRPSALDIGDGSVLDESMAAQVGGFLEAILDEVARAYSGREDFCRRTLTAIMSGGHVLYEGVPGTGKTTLVHTLSQVLGCTFKRIQFTPDLLPSDITGVHMYDQEENKFVLRRGPVFANIVLADEINRAPAKTQAALLEAMQERQVTIEGATMTLPLPFVVMATQNPIESEGVYSLPEAQMDRFLMRLLFGYPSPEEEMRMLSLLKAPAANLDVLCTQEQLKALQRLSEQLHVEQSVMQYIVDLVGFTRTAPGVRLGCGPRGCVGLLRAGRAHALCSGRVFVLPDDVRDLAMDVLAHRIILSTEAELAGTTQGDVIASALKQVAVPGDLARG